MSGRNVRREPRALPNPASAICLPVIVTTSHHGGNFNGVHMVCTSNPWRCDQVTRGAGLTITNASAMASIIFGTNIGRQQLACCEIQNLLVKTCITHFRNEAFSGQASVKRSDIFLTTEVALRFTISENRIRKFE